MGRFIISSRLKLFNGSAPFRYFIVAVAGFAIDFAIYASIVTSGQSIYLAHVTGFIVGGAVNVVLIRRFVFRDSRFTLLNDIFLTLVANGTMLFLGLAMLWFMVDHLFINPYWAKLIANGITFLLNYFTDRKSVV